MDKQELTSCPECGSTDKVNASKKVRARQWVQRYLCKKCLRVYTPTPDQTPKA